MLEFKLWHYGNKTYANIFNLLKYISLRILPSASHALVTLHNAGSTRTRTLQFHCACLSPLSSAASQT